MENQINHSDRQEIPEIVYKILKMPLKIALTSFAIGTFLLLLFFVAPEKDPVIGVGVCYVILAFIINSAAFLTFIGLSFRHSEYRWDIIGRAGLLLINIPIAYLYFICVMRITLNGICV